MAVIAGEESSHRQDLGSVIGEEVEVQPRQTVPRFGRSGMMRVVIGEVENKQVQQRMIGADDIE